ncbi:mechanosensitive ion channel [Psychroflexus gondwanensis]|uniref:Small mechanosensitive channel protein, MscS family n=1 Tax=Psychroflexus gondwanensis ACAM 44 TaxID=1189619 RepID=N1WQK6_9FLAO|nr:mechanosensitive ion channel domain-containing protein [Psychroflexus gondwanensis]EMY82561.1 small mechanosensitive channel protein, MscS family [Psychroflexus gondwanensis ACAM 44]TXE21219.1 mechanosensitive ion channel [Psychroflexus gondwanensis]
MENISIDSVGEYANYFLDKILSYLPSIIAALVILILGLWVIKLIIGRLRKIMEKREVDPGVRGFSLSILGVVLNILLFIVIITKLGVETTSFAAILAAAALAIGLALQGSLSNFAGGVLIIVLKPYRVGDFIEAQGESGTVTDISIFYTILTTTNNQRVIIPNGQLSNNKVTNYSYEPTRRNNMTVGISYDSDIKKSREVLLNIVNSDERVLKDPAPVVYVEGLGDNSVDLSLRFWANQADYWGLHFDTIEKLKTELEDAGVSFPFPQRDVHLYDMSKEK